MVKRQHHINQRQVTNKQNLEVFWQLNSIKLLLINMMLKCSIYNMYSIRIHCLNRSTFVDTTQSSAKSLLEGFFFWVNGFNSGFFQSMEWKISNQRRLEGKLARANILSLTSLLHEFEVMLSSTLLASLCDPTFPSIILATSMLSIPSLTQALYPTNPNCNYVDLT